ACARRPLLLDAARGYRVLRPRRRGDDQSQRVAGQAASTPRLRGGQVNLREAADTRVPIPDSEQRFGGAGELHRDCSRHVQRWIRSGLERSPGTWWIFSRTRRSDGEVPVEVCGSPARGKLIFTAHAETPER